MSQPQLAALANTSQPQIWRLENSERKLSKEWAERLAPHLGVRPVDLLFDNVMLSPDPPVSNILPFDSPSEKPNAIVRGQVDSGTKMIPVYGRAVGGVDGEFDMNGSLLGHVLAPPSLAGINGVYAVQVSGDSMSPRYEDGETCYIDPKYRVKRGDYVVAQIQFEEGGPLLAFVKKFCRQNSHELVLEQFNPPKELRFPATAVVTVHYIALAGNA